MKQYLTCPAAGIWADLCMWGHTGGGLAGLTAAERLANHGIAVTVYDMGRSPGVTDHFSAKTKLALPRASLQRQMPWLR